MVLGFFVGKLWGLIWSALFILGVELFQLFSGFGVFDFTDIFMNCLGVYVGYLIFDALYKRLSVRTINRAVAVCLYIAMPVAILVTVNSILNFPV